jgi:hypothetical protein
MFSMFRNTTLAAIAVVQPSVNCEAAKSPKGYPDERTPSRQNNDQGGVTMFSMFRNSMLAAIVAGLGLLVAASLPAKATLITYTFSPDASMTFPEASGSDVIHFSGQFTVDTTQSQLPAVSITATCSGTNCPDPLIVSGAGFQLAVLATPTSINIPFSPSDDIFTIVFASSLLNFSIRVQLT